jgi:hypothetical protein
MKHDKGPGHGLGAPRTIMSNRKSHPVICIYTCAAHERLHAEFHDSAIGKYLGTFGGARQIYVYADDRLSESRLENGRLTVSTREAYSNLCLKTFKMIQFCAREIPFDFLMKIDVTSGIESMNRNPNVLNRVANQQALIDYLDAFRKDLLNNRASDYTGWKLITANRNGVERWAKLKDLEVDYDKLLGESPPPQYFSGKCYSISRGFASYVAETGEQTACEHTACVPGSEDMMIGRLYKRFKDDLGVHEVD